MSPALTAAKTRHQQELEKNYPATLTIGSVNYKGCVGIHTGPFMTLDGGTKQIRSATFQVRQSILPLSLIRDTTQATQPLKRILITHLETGLVYRLDEEFTDPHGVTRTLTCTQPEH
jgi:hypothetical protein